MPIIQESSYLKRPRLYFNAWLETLIPYLTSGKNLVNYERERLELKDGDFIDLDWSKNGSKKLIVISHGFEGNSKDHFIQQSAEYFKEKSIDVLVWDYRSCSSDLNRLPRFYDHGDIDDLHEVITHATRFGSYNHVILLGFSMGGNFVINYLGSGRQSTAVKCGIVFSTPMDLLAASRRLKHRLNKWVERSLIKKMKNKVIRKAEIFPESFDLRKISNIDSLEQLYEECLLPLHGISSMNEYFTKWSSSRFLSKIEIPLLIVNAQNDPLLSRNCYPYKTSANSENVFLETPRYGGHTGFSGKTNGKRWYLQRIDEFLSEKVEEEPH